MRSRVGEGGGGGGAEQTLSTAKVKLKPWQRKPRSKRLKLPVGLPSTKILLFVFSVNDLS